jgi:RNase H-like domain found in reverse transcriptase
MSLKHWRHYLEGSRYPFVVEADHANLRYFMTTKELSRRQVR